MESYSNFHLLQKFLTSHEKLPPGDYVSPSFTTVINVDSCFPNKILGDFNNIRNPYFRKEIKHNWYVDKNFPECGFLTRDEVHILFHCALLFRGKNALEIGSHTGWSTVHLALAGENPKIQIAKRRIVKQITYTQEKLNHSIINQ
jgi:hypothetical protein